MEVPLEGDMQGSTGEGSSPEEDSGHGHVGVHPGPMQQPHRSHMLKKFQCLMEGLPNEGSSTLLRKIYTDLYITEGGRGDVNEEHEVRQIERASWREAAQGRPIKCSDIFEHLTTQGKASIQQVKDLAKEGQQSSEQVKPIGIVLTKGVAGIGKTVSVQKFILDWAEGTSNQDLDFIFPLPFRELNLMKEKTFSLIDLIRHFFTDVEGTRVFTSSENRVMFIFDGLDECRLPLKFHSNPECCDVTKSVPVDVLLTNLIKGKLLPSALLWITTRPAAANQIPHEYVNQVTEIQGFNNPQKEEYFMNKISDESLARRTIAHLKSSRILFIMCHIPVFSWILATVVEKTSDGSGSAAMPRTLTQMYTHFLIIQVRIKHTKYTESDKTDEEIISKLGKLAFQQLEKGNLIFYEEDLIECGIDVKEASVYSGVCTQIFREEAGLYQGKVFSFIHLSIQEFLAALYVFLCFTNRERNMPDQHHTSQLSALFRASTLHNLHMTALDLALQSENGHLDLFLRFLLGLSLESNQSLLKHLLPQTSSQSQSSEQTVQLVKQNIRQQKESNRRINLFYCLNELNQHAVVERIDRSSGTLSVEMLLPGQWETGMFHFKTSEEYLDGFDLQKYIKTPELDKADFLSLDGVLQNLTDVFTSSTSAELESCPLSEKSLAHLSSALTPHSSRLTHLQLKGTDRYSSSSLHVSSSAGCHPDCKTWELCLQRYDLTEEICYLVSALTSHTSTLYGKQLKKEEVERLCSTVSHQDCRLEKLQLDDCPLSENSCSHLSSALTSHLTQLQLNVFIPDESAAEKLTALQNDPHYQVEFRCASYGRSKWLLDLSCRALEESEGTTLSAHHQQQSQDGDTQRGCGCCKYCAEVPDTSHWVPVEPEVSTEKSISTYSLSSAAGIYECSLSGLRWLCPGPVTLQYHFVDWHVFAKELDNMQYSPAGPLMDIKLTSGVLEEIHLPHFLCLVAGEASVCDAVRVLHGHDNGVCMEECKLTRHHARIVQPSLSLLGVLWRTVEYLFPPKAHFEPLLFYTRTAPLELHLYLVPKSWDPAHIQAIAKEEEKHTPKGVRMRKPGKSLRLNANVCVTTSCQSEIQPIRRDLSELLSPSTSDYFEVYIEHPGDSFDMEIISPAENGEPIWKRKIRRGDYQPDESSQAIRIPGQVSSWMAAAFLEERRPELIQRVTEVMPIADQLFSQRAIGQETYANIQAAATSQDKMRLLFEGLRSAGAQGKLAFYMILQTQLPYLVEELWNAG